VELSAGFLEEVLELHGGALKDIVGLRLAEKDLTFHACPQYINSFPTR
jgi:hypothetical protein